MARESAVVLDFESEAAASRARRHLENRGLDVERDRARIWCFGSGPESAAELHDRVQGVLAREQLEHTLVIRPSVRIWNGAHRRYVEPDAPDEDPDTRDVWIETMLDPADIEWRVRLELQSIFHFRAVRRRLPELERPLIGEGNRHIDLGARNEADAGAVAERASSIPGIARARTARLGRVARWLLRQRLAGNYAATADGGFMYVHGDVGGGGGAGDGGGHGGGGGHH